MKQRYGIVLSVFVFIFLIHIPPGFAQQDVQETQAGEENIQETLPEAPEPVQWLSPEQAKKSRLSSQKTTQKYQQQWCLEQEGLMNVVLSDNSICGCLTDTHAVEFPSATNWAESLGRVLYLSLMTDREPGLVIFHEPEQPPSYMLLLDTLTTHYELPVTVWKQEVIFEKDEEQQQPTPSNKSGAEQSSEQEEESVPFMLNEPQVEP